MRRKVFGGCWGPGSRAWMAMSDLYPDPVFGGGRARNGASHTADQILAKLGPELRQSRGPKRRPLIPGPQWVRSVERGASPVSKDISKNKSAAESNRGHYPSTSRSRSRNREGPPQCYKCKGYGHFMRDCPSSDFYAVGPNGMPVKKCEMSQERHKPRDGPLQSSL